MRPRTALLADGPLAAALLPALGHAAPDCVVTCSGDLLAEVAAGRFDLIVAPAAPVELLGRLRARDPLVPIVAVASSGDVELASAVVHAGASDLLVLGPRLEERVQTLLRKLAPVVRLREESARRRGADEPWALLGDAPGIREVRARIARIAHVPRPVLILGERGSGKELVARALHEAGGPGRPLVVVNCAAFPDALLESELFGHERGAYTGAERRVPGRFELADGGTLFLDEIATMSTAFQQKVLRVVEYGVFTRVGGTEELRTTARVIAATNADLEERMAAGTFLPDLYDRLAFEVLRVPPLRDRPSDIPALARHFLARFAKELPELGGRSLSPEAERALLRYPFPGNVRELKLLVERAACRGEDGPVTVADLGLPAGRAVAGTLEERVDTFRRSVVEAALREAGGNQAAAARGLGITYDQLRHWVRKYRIGRVGKR